jgi:hypothetical protein
MECHLQFASLNKEKSTIFLKAQSSGSSTR